MYSIRYKLISKIIDQLVKLMIKMGRKEEETGMSIETGRLVVYLASLAAGAALCYLWEYFKKK